MPPSTSQHLTSSVIMVQPIDFGFNEQTGTDNEFQCRPSFSELENINYLVADEFNGTINTLQSLGVETLVLGKTHTKANLPDAIFPNNWFCTRNNGTNTASNSGEIHIFPMKTQNRQDEVQVTQLSNLAHRAGYHLDKIVDLRTKLTTGSVLEGTGSLIFHHPSQTLFAALSERCQRAPLEQYSQQFGYRLVSFETASANGAPIYHTNVLMSCGRDFAVIADCVVSPSKASPSKKKSLLLTLEETVGELLLISEEQMRVHFCGNILQLEDLYHQPVIALSESAYSGFTPRQKKILEGKGSLAVCKIPTIERIGGGSTRCMLAENFLPKKRSFV